MDKFELQLEEAIEIAEENVSRYTCGDCSKVFAVTGIKNVDYRQTFVGLALAKMVHIVAIGVCPLCQRRLEFYLSEYEDAVIHRRRLKSRQLTDKVQHLERCLSMGGPLDHD